jgi:hypothetical protein
LQVAIYVLVEYALQLSTGMVTKMTENPEKSALLRKHIIEIHVDARIVEKNKRIRSGYG